jgi:hypothetical protein
MGCGMDTRYRENFIIRPCYAETQASTVDLRWWLPAELKPTYWRAAEKLLFQRQPLPSPPLQICFVLHASRFTPRYAVPSPQPPAPPFFLGA